LRSRPAHHPWKSKSYIERPLCMTLSVESVKSKESFICFSCSIFQSLGRTLLCLPLLPSRSLQLFAWRLEPLGVVEVVLGARPALPWECFLPCGQLLLLLLVQLRLTVKEEQPLLLFAQLLLLINNIVQFLLPFLFFICCLYFVQSIFVLLDVKLLLFTNNSFLLFCQQLFTFF